MDYREYNDYELLYMIGEKSEEAYEILQKKYEPLIYKKSSEINKYLKNNGFEMQDLIQEGRMALSEAIKNYRDDYNEFITFAHTCIENRILHVNRKFNSNKNKVLNLAMQNNNNVFNQGIGFDNLYVENSNSNEKIDFSTIKNYLSKEEYEIILLKLCGYSVGEIAQIIGSNNRHISYEYSVIKKKLEKIKNG